MVFDPNYTLTNISSGFPIFATEESLNAIPARYDIIGPDPKIMTVFLHAQIVRPGQYDSYIRVTVKTETDFNVESETLFLTFDRPEMPLIFSSALLGGLLVVLQNTQKNVPLLVCSSSDFLSRVLVKDRPRFENDFLDHLLRAVLAALNQRVARIYFKKVSNNHAQILPNINTRVVEVDTEIDIMLECPGILLSKG
jgi:hypothetical protein